jgi:hypothetical protein
LRHRSAAAVSEGVFRCRPLLLYPSHSLPLSGYGDDFSHLALPIPQGRQLYAPVLLASFSAGLGESRSGQVPCMLRRSRYEAIGSLTAAAALSSSGWSLMRGGRGGRTARGGCGWATASRARWCRARCGPGPPAAAAEVLPRRLLQSRSVPCSRARCISRRACRPGYDGTAIGARAIVSPPAFCQPL